MCKKLFLLVFSLLSCHSLFSQDQWTWDATVPKQEKNLTMALGPKAGCGMAIGNNLTTYNIDFHSGLAYQFGVSVNMKLGQKHEQNSVGMNLFGIAMEAMYGIRNLGTRSGKMTIRCVEIPLLFQYYPTPSLAVEAGPTFVRTLKCIPDQLQFDNAVLNIGQISGGDIMLTFGACYKTPFSLVLDLRYNFGLSNMAGNLDCKNSSLMFSVAYLFELIK